MKIKHDCKELLGPLSDYISEEISDSMCARIQEHLAECQDCQEMLESIKRTISLYRSTAPAELPLDVRRRLYQALDLDEFF
ncbi:MAG: zf-HC2 domain-containing protein [Anaerolineales bacterium]|nr:zf-HC2 domain-containing protein [Anaerolineales bacterium]